MHCGRTADYAGDAVDSCFVAVVAAVGIVVGAVALVL